MRRYLSKKQYVIFVLSLMVLIVSGFSYAIFYSVEDIDNNIVKTNCFKIVYEDANDITLEKTYPLEDEEGKKLIPYTFTVSNVCNTVEAYSINIETLNKSTMSQNNIRYEIDDNNTSKLGEQTEVTTYINNDVKDSRNIISGSLSKDESITYNLSL